MGLSIAQIKVAKLLASGCSVTDAAKKADVARSSIYNYQKSDEFNAAVQLFNDERAAASENADPVSIESSADKERELVAKLDTLAHTLADATQGLADHLNDLSPEDVSIRLLPSFVAALRNVIEVKRQGEDRVSGIEGLLDDLASIEATVAQKVVSIHRSSPNGAA